MVTWIRVKCPGRETFSTIVVVLGEVRLVTLRRRQDVLFELVDRCAEAEKVQSLGPRRCVICRYAVYVFPQSSYGVPCLHAVVRSVRYVIAFPSGVECCELV